MQERFGDQIRAQQAERLASRSQATLYSDKFEVNESPFSQSARLPPTAAGRAAAAAAGGRVANKAVAGRKAGKSSRQRPPVQHDDSYTYEEDPSSGSDSSDSITDASSSSDNRRRRSKGKKSTVRVGVWDVEDANWVEAAAVIGAPIAVDVLHNPSHL